MYYSHAKAFDAGWRGRIYQYDETGSREILVLLLPSVRVTCEEAVDDAVQWCEDNGHECEIDFGE